LFAFAFCPQVLRYAPSQAYVPHTDYFGYQTSPDHNWDSRDGGTNRFATVFLYLSDVEAGGETVFPKANTLHNRTQQLASAGNRDPPPSSESEEKVLSTGSWEEKMAETCSSQFAVNPKKGDALLFYSQQPNGTLDEMSLHGGCPVLSGVKVRAYAAKNPPLSFHHCTLRCFEFSCITGGGFFQHPITDARLSNSLSLPTPPPPSCKFIVGC